MTAKADKLGKLTKKLRQKVANVPRPALTSATVILFAVIGTILLVSSHAATPAASYEAEAGTRSGNVATVADTGASGGSTVKFGTAPTSSCTLPDRVTVTAANKATTYPAYPLGTKLWTQDGPDPWGGCFPGANNTGVPPGTQLTAYTGSCSITTANTVIDKKIVNCDRFDMRAQGIKITNSLINGRVYLDYDWCSTASFTITDSTVITGDWQSRALMYCNYTATRVNLSGGGSMAICQSCTIQDSYLHDPIEDPTGHAHNSTVRIWDHANIIHNTLWCSVKSYNATDGSGESSGCSANQTGYSHDGTPPYNSTMKRNFYASTSGGYCAWGGSTGGAGADQVHDIKFIENIFQRGHTPDESKQPFSYICGLFGPLAGFENLPGNEFTSNIWDNGKPVVNDQPSWYDYCGSQPQCTW